jgi:hypothetical protein
MILRERHSIGPVAIHPSRLRATACHADVRFNPDGRAHNAHSTVGNPPKFRSGNGSRCTRAHRSLSSRNSAGHLALIEIP